MREKWVEILDELMSPQQRARLENRIHEEILIKGEQFTEQKANDFADGIALLGKIVIAHRAFTEKHGTFGDMFGTYLADTGQLSGVGQFFTPMNVVDLMVQCTMGDDLDEKPLNILDPAAGTGRFMLGTAKHYVAKIGKLNFVFFNIDIDFKVYVYCAMNAILNGIPAVTVWGDTLMMRYYEGVVTIPIGNVAMWKLLNSDAITMLMNRFEPRKAKEPQQLLQAETLGEPPTEHRPELTQPPQSETKQLTLVDFKVKGKD